MSIFDELSDFGGERCAVHIGARSFASLALSSFGDALSQSLGKNLQLPCPSVDPPYAVRLISVNGKSKIEPVDFANAQLRFTNENGDIFLKVADSLRLEFALGFLENNSLQHFSKLTLRLSHLKFKIEASEGQLMCAPGAATLRSCICRLPNFDSVIGRYTLSFLSIDTFLIGPQRTVVTGNPVE